MEAGETPKKPSNKNLEKVGEEEKVAENGWFRGGGGKEKKKTK